MNDAYITETEAARLCKTLLEKSAEIESLTARIVELESALEPFLVHYEGWMDEYPDGGAMHVFARVTYGDVRRARAIINKGKQP